MSLVLIPLVIWMGMCTAGCGTAPPPANDSQVREGGEAAQSGAYVEIRTFDGEHFFAILVERTQDSITVGEKERWECEDRLQRRRLFEKQVYRFDELKLLDAAGPKGLGTQVVEVLAMGMGVALVAFTALLIYVEVAVDWSGLD